MVAAARKGIIPVIGITLILNGDGGVYGVNIHIGLTRKFVEYTMAKEKEAIHGSIFRTPQIARDNIADWLTELGFEDDVVAIEEMLNENIAYAEEVIRAGELGGTNG